jgi:ankyrin repeat protein
VYWTVFSLTGMLLVAWALDRSGDAATRGLGQFYALLGLPFAGIGLLVFLLTRRAIPRVLAMIVTGVSLVFLGLMLAFARFGYLIERYRQSSGHVFSSADGRGLGEAIERRDLARIRALAAAGADLNARGRDGTSPLSFALDRKQVEAARLLVELGANPLRGEGAAGHPPLFEMAATDDLSGLLKLTLERGANASAVRDDEMTLLQWAIGYRAFANVGLIVAASARLDTRDDAHELKSPLGFALERRLWEYARFLVEHGAPLEEAPGYNGLDAVVGNIEPPKEGDSDRGEYLLLVKAMTDRGYAFPARQR